MNLLLRYSETSEVCCTVYGVVDCKNNKEMLRCFVYVLPLYTLHVTYSLKIDAAFSSEMLGVI